MNEYEQMNLWPKKLKRFW